MFTLVLGNAKQVYTVFGRAFFAASCSDEEGRQQLEKDFPRSRFLGSKSQVEQHVAIWRDPEQTSAGTYTQGNMDARNLAETVLGNKPFFAPVNQDGSPIDQIDTPPAQFQQLVQQNAEYTKQYKKYEYAYISDSGELCGISLQFCANAPTKWICSLIKKTNLPPVEREVYVLLSEKNSNFPHVVDHELHSTREETVRCPIHEDQDALTIFRASIDSGLVTRFFDIAFSRPEEGIDARCAIFDVIAQQVKEGAFQDNSTLLHVVLNPDSAASSSASTASITIETMLQSHALLSKLGVAGASLHQIEQVLKQDGCLYQQIQSKADCDQAFITTAVQLECWGVGEARINLLNMDGFAPAFARLFADSPYRDMLRECLCSQSLSDQELHGLFTMMANDPLDGGMARCLKTLYDTHFDLGYLMSIASNPDAHALARLMARYGIVGKEITGQTNHPNYFKAMQEIEQFLNSSGCNIDSEAKPYIKSGIQAVMRYFAFIQFFDSEKPLENCMTSLLTKLDDNVSDAVARLQISLSKQIYRIAKRHEAALLANLPANELVVTDNTWLDAALGILEQQHQTSEAYREVYVHINGVSTPPSVTGLPLENALAALRICRSRDISSEQLPLARFLNSPSLSERVIKWRADWADRNIVSHWLCVPEPELESRLAILNRLDELFTKSGRTVHQGLTILVMDDTFFSHVFRCFQRLVDSVTEVEALYDKIYANKYQVSASPLTDDLMNKILFARELGDLGIENFNAAIQLLTGDSEQSDKFYRALCMVGNKCAEIQWHLKQVAPDGKYLEYLQKERAFRKKIYEIAYQELTNPEPNTLATRISDAHASISDSLNKDRSAFLRRCLKGLVNALTLILTGTALNFWHKNRTGDFLFFSRPKSSELLQEAIVELPTVIGAPAA